MRQRLIILAVVYGVVWMLTACASLLPAAPFPALNVIDQTEITRVIRSRTTGLHTLAAVLSVSFSDRARQGTFDLVVNYDDSGKMRYTAFKDLILSTRPIFDLLLVDATYRLELHDDTEGNVRQGSVSHFSQDNPAFRAFWIVGEAFFLPGFDGRGDRPLVTATQPLQFTTRLKSGAVAHWVAKAETLEISQAQIDDSRGPDTVSLLLEYGDYRKIGAYDIPHRVTLTDASAGFVTRSFVKQVDINMPLTPGVFDHAASAAQAPPIHGIKAFLLLLGWPSWLPL